MMYIIKCKKCNNQSIVEINEEKDKICGVCKADGEHVEVVDLVENVMPSPEEIAEGLKLTL